MYFSISRICQAGYLFLAVPKGNHRGSADASLAGFGLWGGWSVFGRTGFQSDRRTGMFSYDVVYGV